jgi:hypothetical protein
MHPVIPPSTLVGSANAGGIQFTWTGSSDSVLGYNVYRATDPSGPFTRMNASPVTSTSFTDTNAFSNTYTYMVRAIKLELTPSGTYFNASQGIFITLTAATPTQLVPVSVSSIASAQAGISLSWSSVPGRNYRVAFVDDIADTNWIYVIPDLQAEAQTLSWTDSAAQKVSRRFYRVFEVR